MANKIRTVIYAEEGATTYVEGMIRHENFKSESDAYSYLIALGIQSHNQQRIDRAVANMAEADHE